MEIIAADTDTALARMLDSYEHPAILVDPEECKQLVEEWHLLQWDPEDKTKEDKRFPNHCSADFQSQ